MTDSVGASDSSKDSRSSGGSDRASGVDKDTQDRTRSAIGGGGKDGPRSVEPTSRDRAQGQDRMRQEGEAAKGRTMGEMPGDSTGSTAVANGPSPEAEIAKDMIDRNTTRKNQRSGGVKETVQTGAIANEVLDLAREKPEQAVEVRQEVSRQLSPEDRAKFEENLVEALQQDAAASVALAKGQEVQPVDAETVVAQADALIEEHTKTTTHKQHTRTSLDINSLSYDVEQLAETDPSLAVAVKNQLALDLPAGQAADMNRIISGNATLGENIEIAFENPVEGLKGAGKGIVNGFSAIGEIFAKGAVHQAAGQQYQAGGMSALLGNDELAAQQMELGDELNEAARNTDFVPQFEISNRAQAGGETIGTAIDIALAGKGLVTGGAKALAGLSDEALALTDNVAGTFKSTPAVSVSGARAIDKATDYEQAVRGLYGDAAFAERQFSAIVDGQRVNGIADDVVTIDGLPTAVEAKLVDDWATSLRNPDSPVGQQHWAQAEQQAMINQARRYDAGFEGGVIYHTNSPELAAHYSDAFREAGIENFDFVITPTQ